jgi:hypothetical protein
MEQRDQKISDGLGRNEPFRGQLAIRHHFDWKALDEAAWAERGERGPALSQPFADLLSPENDRRPTFTVNSRTVEFPGPACTGETNYVKLPTTPLTQLASSTPLALEAHRMSARDFVYLCPSMQPLIQV